MVLELFINFLIIFLIQLLFFVIAFLFKTDKVTDLAYGLSFVILTLVNLFQNPRPDTWQIIVSLAIVIWGLRLTAYLFIRILKIKKDKRFDQIRKGFWSLAEFWIFQTVAVWLILLPYFIFLKKPTDHQPGWLSLTGLIIWLTGIIIETTADWQKFKFKNKNPKKWTNIGLWKYARHPNYFGEMLCWAGLFLSVLPYLSGWELTTVVSPIFIIFMLLFVSGVPILAKRHQKKYGKKTAYKKYKRNTRLLIPLPKFTK